jgi:hypothetical protein
MTLDAQIWDSLKRYRSSIPYGCSRYSRISAGVHSDTLANDGTPRTAKRARLGHANARFGRGSSAAGKEVRGLSDFWNLALPASACAARPC